MGCSDLQDPAGSNKERDPCQYSNSNTFSVHFLPVSSQSPFLQLFAPLVMALLNLLVALTAAYLGRHRERRSNEA